MPEKQTILQKVQKISAEVQAIAKTGENKTQHYSYVKAEDVLRTIREKLAEHNLVLTAQATKLSHFSDTGGKSFVTTVCLFYTLTDTETGEAKAFDWIGAGADIGGDKGLYKAYTGGLKYFLLNLFLIPTGDDPEADEKIDKQQPRSATPEIPLDRAKDILDKAVLAGLADGIDLKPVLKAKLVDVGVETGKLGHLNVDAAEAVEAWIAEEAAKC